jgi:hypothetical protein
VSEINAPVEAMPMLCALPAGATGPEPWLDRLRTGVGRTLDQAVVEAMRRVIDAALMPRETELPVLRAAAAPFCSGPLWAEPRRFFPFLDAPADTLVSETRYRRGLRGGRIVGRRFASRYVPFGDPTEPDASADRILVEHWMHTDAAPRATVLALHGFSMGQPRIDAWALFAAQWFAHGLDVALMTLPYHGARAPRGARFSGQRFTDPNPATLNEAVRRAVYEMHAVGAWLRERTGAPVGLLGLSLGGYLSALMAGLGDDFAFAIPMVPPVCMGELAWHFVGSGSSHRRRATAYSYDELRAMFRVHSPLTYPLRLPPERVMIIAGRGDRIVPPEHPYALWEHWRQPRIHWFSGSHLAPFGRDRIVAAVVEHLRGLGIL